MKRYLVLENGTVFEGEAFGADASAVGELVFTTAMVGYTGTLTDPCYYGQIVLQTFPLIGNYGITEEDFAGKCCLSGYVVRSICDTPSNFRSEYTVDEFLKRNGIPGICGIDTRAVTSIIREGGVCAAMICDTVPESLEKLKAYAVRNAVYSTTDGAVKTYAPTGERTARVAVLDLGAKNGIISALQRRGCEVVLLPAQTKASVILSMETDGIVLSGGAGDPAENGDIIKETSELFGNIPMFGVGLGHQIMALARGGQTQKMKCGHRGANQPVKDLLSGRVYITNQNHGYSAAADGVQGGTVRYINVNDGTCEGIDYEKFLAFSVQFDVRDGGDTEFVFDRFCSMMKGGV